MRDFEDVEGLASELEQLAVNVASEMGLASVDSCIRCGGPTPWMGEKTCRACQPKALNQAAATLRDLSRKLEQQADATVRAHQREHALLELVAEREAALEEARAEAERVQMLPELEWAEVTASIMQEVARVARAGYQPNAKAMQDVMDRGKTYVVRLRAALEEARRDGARLDWLEANMAVVWPPTEQSKRWAALPVPYGSTNGDGGGATLREAIDIASRALSPQPQEPETLRSYCPNCEAGRDLRPDGTCLRCGFQQEPATEGEEGT